MARDRRVYWVWSAMIQRCTNPRDKSWKNYGGRGITVCDRWRVFAFFAEDMGPRPAGAMIERRDNDAGYGPGNCYWETDRRVQSGNRRSCIYVQVAGRRVAMKEAWRRAAAPGLTYRRVMTRIARGWSPERALLTPPKQLREVIARRTARL